MSTTVTPTQSYYVILIDSDKSGESPRGQKDAYPIKYIEFPDLGSTASLSDDSTSVSPAYPLFSTFDLESGDIGKEAGASLVHALDGVLQKLRVKQAPTKITLIKVVNQDKDGNLDITKYEPHTTVELDKATLHLVRGTTCTYQVQADKAIFGVGDKASSKTSIDYKNRV